MAARVMLARSLSRPRRQNSHRADADKRCEPYLKWLRGRACALASKRDHDCRGQIRACHVDYAGDKGVGTKVSDRHALPMCDGAHEEQHRIGWHPFEAKWGLNAIAIADQLYSLWLNATPMGAKWKAARNG